MNKLIYIPTLLFLAFIFCSKKTSTPVTVTNEDTEIGCPYSDYPNWETSAYVLPYPVGKTYPVNLSHCTFSYHAEGSPDQYGIDFDMPIGTYITAARAGTVVHVEESGTDGHFPNNLVVIRHPDYTFAQYMHLTQNGALVNIGDEVKQGAIIGRSGSTGLAGYPHLHFIITRDDWQYPYTGIPFNFKNTRPNPRSLEMGTDYPAYSY